jgi:hypothetical protein
MLKNYFKTTWRNLAKDRRFTLLNLLGLSTGLACTLLIYLWVAIPPFISPVSNPSRC